MSWRTIISLLVLIAAFGLIVVDQLDFVVGGMIVALAIANLVPPTRVG